MLNMVTFTGNMINMIDWSELHIQICQCFFLILSGTLVVFDLVEDLRNWHYYSCETNENTLSYLRYHSWPAVNYTFKYKERIFIVCVSESMITLIF